jgi:hypothetical protein
VEGCRYVVGVGGWRFFNGDTQIYIHTYICVYVYVYIIRWEILDLGSIKGVM